MTALDLKFTGKKIGQKLHTIMHGKKDQKKPYHAV